LYSCFSPERIQLKPLYEKYRLLTSSEEKQLASFCVVGKRLTTISSVLHKKLNRPPTMDEYTRLTRLSPQQFHCYLKAYKKAQTVFVHHNLRLIHYEIKKLSATSIRARNVPASLLLLGGIEGVLQAAANYDGRARFSTFASLYIKSNLYHTLSMHSTNRYTAKHHDIQLISRANRLISIMKEKGDIVTDQAITRLLNISCHSYQGIRRLTSIPVTYMCETLGRGVNRDIDKETFLSSSHDTLHFEHTISNIVVVDRVVEMDRIELWESYLTDIEKQIVRMKYGFGYNTRYTDKEVAEELNITYRKLRKMNMDIFKKLRVFLK